MSVLHQEQQIKKGLPLKERLSYFGKNKKIIF